MPVVAATYGEAVKGSIIAVSQFGSTIASSSVKTMTSPRAASTPRLRARDRPGREADTMVMRVSSILASFSRVWPVSGALSTTTSVKR